MDGFQAWQQREGYPVTVEIDGYEVLADHSHECRGCGGSVFCGQTEEECERDTNFNGYCQDCD